MFRLMFIYLWCLFSAAATAAEIPDLSLVVFEDPNDEQKKQLEGFVEAIELLSVSDDRFVARCDGSLAVSGTSGERAVVSLKEIRFVYAEDATSNKMRLISVEEDAFTDAEGAAEGDGVLSLIDAAAPIIDVLVDSKGEKRTAVYALDGMLHTLGDGIDPISLMRHRVIFNPFNAVLSSAAELKGSTLVLPAMGRFQSKAINGYGVVKDLTVGRWFFNLQRQGAVTTRTETGLIRWIAFRNGLPVVIEDRLGIPSPSSKGRSLPFSRTDIRWSEVEKDTWRPVAITSRQFGQYHMNIEMDAKIRWVRGAAVSDSHFSPDSLGTYSFGE